MIENISSYIDYTVLKPDTGKEKIIQLCNGARENNCASVCVNPYYVELAKSLLKETDVKVCSVVGFPLGATFKETKAFEANMAIADGADEIDMVINIGALKDKDFDIVKDDIMAVSKICKENHILLKVIIENCLLTDLEKEIATKIVAESGADFVKTSTGFSTSGATLEDVTLMKKTIDSINSDIKIKAAGGIKDYKTACKMIEAGASRIGASSLIKENEIKAEDY